MSLCQKKCPLSKRGCHSPHPALTPSASASFRSFIMAACSSTSPSCILGLLHDYSSDSSQDQLQDASISLPHQDNYRDSQPSSGTCSATEEEQTQQNAPPRALNNSTTTAYINSRSYAAKLSELPPDICHFLRAVRTFFTQKVNLQRQKAALSQSTYDKAEERMLCKFSPFSNGLLLSAILSSLVHSFFFFLRKKD